MQLTKKLALHKESLGDLSPTQADAVDGGLQLVQSLRLCSVFSCIRTLQRGCPSLAMNCTSMAC